MQSGFVTAFVLAAWLGLDKVTFCCCKLFLNFVAVTSFKFLLSTFFVAVGLDNELKPSPFRLLLARAFFVCCFHFIPQVAVLLFFGGSFSVDNLALCIFKKQFLKSCLALQCWLFVVAVFGGHG